MAEQWEMCHIYNTKMMFFSWSEIYTNGHEGF